MNLSCKGTSCLKIAVLLLWILIRMWCVAMRAVARMHTITLREKSPNTAFYLVCIFPHSDWTRRDTPYLSVFSPNAGKCGPEKTSYLDTFHAVLPKMDLFVNYFCKGLYVRCFLRSWLCVRLFLDSNILQNRCFSVKFAKFLRTLYLQITSGGCFCKLLLADILVYP